MRLKLKVGAQVTLKIKTGLVGKIEGEADIASANYEWVLGKNGWRLEKFGNQGVGVSGKFLKAQGEASIVRTHSIPGNNWGKWAPTFDGDLKGVPLDGVFGVQGGILISPGFEVDLKEMRNYFND